MSAQRRYPVLERVFGTVPGVRWLVGAITATAIGCALVMRMVDPTDFPSYGEAFWWSIQTVTTVGYGDVTPKTNKGRAVASVLMIAAIAAISLLTAAIAAGFVNRVQRRRPSGTRIQSSSLSTGSSSGSSSWSSASTDDRAVKQRTASADSPRAIAGAVYGTIVVMATLAAGGSGEANRDAWQLAVFVLATVVVLWLAHVYAHGLAESIERGRRLDRGRTEEGRAPGGSRSCWRRCRR